jgi:hypothetical protein
MPSETAKNATMIVMSSALSSIGGEGSARDAAAP